MNFFFTKAKHTLSFDWMWKAHDSCLSYCIVAILRRKKTPNDNSKIRITIGLKRMRERRENKEQKFRKEFLLIGYTLRGCPHMTENLSNCKSHQELEILH